MEKSFKKEPAYSKINSCKTISIKVLEISKTILLENATNSGGFLMVRDIEKIINTIKKSPKLYEAHFHNCMKEKGKNINAHLNSSIGNPCQNLCSNVLDIMKAVLLENSTHSSGSLSGEDIEYIINNIINESKDMPKFYESNFYNCMKGID